MLSRLLVAMFVVVLTVLPAFAADPLFPRTVLCAVGGMELLRIDELMPKLALSDPQGAVKLPLLRSLNAAGGLPFHDGNTGKFLRIKLAPAEVKDEYSSDKVQYAVNGVHVVDFAGNGSRYLVITHHVMTGTTATSIWHQQGTTWSCVFKTAGGPSHGGHAAFRKTATGLDLLAWSPEYTWYSWDNRTKKFIPHAAVISRMPTSLSLPDGMKTVVPQLLKTTAAWSSRKLVEEPAAAAKALGEVPAGTAIWKLGTKDGFMLVLVPVAAPGEAYAAYAGKCWEMGWMSNAE